MAQNMDYARRDYDNTLSNPQPASTTVNHFNGNEGWTQINYKNFNGDYVAKDYNNNTRTPGTFQARNHDNTTRTPAAYQRHDINNNAVSA